MFKNYIIKVANSVCSFDRAFAELRHDINNLVIKNIKKAAKDSLVDCDVCGCVVRRENAIVGEKYIAQEPDQLYAGVRWLCTVAQRDVIKTKYYCKLHAPKQKGGKK